LLKDDDATRCFLALLQKYAPRHGVLVRSYCLMGTHPHVVVVATRGQEEFSRFWKVVNQLFARWYNRQQRSRRRQVVTQRMKSPLIQPDSNGRHILSVMRYGDLNPVRAGLVRSPKDYAWSSYRRYAFGEPNRLGRKPALPADGRRPKAGAFQPTTSPSISRSGTRPRNAALPTATSFIEAPICDAWRRPPRRNESVLDRPATS
jgi:hypothetical protein